MCDAVLFFASRHPHSDTTLKYHMFPTNQSVSIRIQQNGAEQVVSARELYEFLQPSERFGNWCKRMFTYGFSLNQDYTPLTFLHPQNGQELTDYALTIDCAKEIAMLQRTEKGKQARLYFIECEKQLRAKQAKEEHEKQVKAIAKLEKQVRQMTIEQARLNDIVKAKVSNPPTPPAHLLKAKILGNIKEASLKPYASDYDIILNSFVWDMKHCYAVDVSKLTRYVGEDAIDVMIRSGYSRQLEELANYKYNKTATSKP